MNRIKKLSLSLMLFVGLLGSIQNLLYAQTAIAPALGNGTTSNPYQISTLENLYWLSQNPTENDKSYLQTANIDASSTRSWNNGEGWEPINFFEGIYNGNGFTIDGLYINMESRDFVGLFSRSVSAVFFNIGLTNVSITGSNITGALVGSSGFSSRINNCYSTGEVFGERYVGGLFGTIYNNKISNSYNECEVNGRDNVGGIAGSNSNSHITNCYNSGKIISTGADVGGLVGYNGGTIFINCYNTGQIFGNINVGGITGTNTKGDIHNIYNLGAIVGQRNVGGIVGYLNNCYIKHCYSIGSVTGEISVGGLVGKTNFTYNRIEDINLDFISDPIENIPVRTSYISIANSCLWDVESSGINLSDGGVGKTTQEMKNIFTYIESGWDFKGLGKDEVWNIGNNRNEGYPYYSSFYPNDPAPENIPPTVFTEKISNIKNNSATAHGIITNKGNPMFTEYGFCWNSTGNPSFEDSIVTLEALEGAGEFSYNLTGLKPYSTYYIRAYAKYIHGTVLGNEILIFTYSTPSGSGNSYDPYLISNLGHLFWIKENPSEWSKEKYYWLTDNINASETSNWNNGEGWFPIGDTENNPFAANFNGRNNTISGLYINRPNADRQALFGYTSGAFIKDLHLKNASISGRTHVGAVVACAKNSQIQNCSSDGSIAGVNYTGGLVGYVYRHSTIQMCSSNANVNGMGSTGGLFGVTKSSKVESCFSSGSVQGSNRVGGLVGNLINAEITDCFSISNVSGISDVGGLVGNASSASRVRNTYSKGLVKGDINTGGLIGVNYNSNVFNSFWDEQTSGLPISSGGTAKTTSGMKNIATFLIAEWHISNNDIWSTWNIDESINNGYPFLGWQPNVSSSIDIISRVAPYPNPFSSSIIVPNSFNVTSFTLYTLTGQKVLYMKNYWANELIINTQNVPSGAYLLVLLFNTGNISASKLIKK